MWTIFSTLFFYTKRKRTENSSCRKIANFKVVATAMLPIKFMQHLPQWLFDMQSSTGGLPFPPESATCTCLGVKCKWWIVCCVLLGALAAVAYECKCNSKKPTTTMQSATLTTVWLHATWRHYGNTSVRCEAAPLRSFIHYGCVRKCIAAIIVVVAIGAQPLKRECARSNTNISFTGGKRNFSFAPAKTGSAGVR